MSRVTAYIAKLIESGWLLALVIVPLFFNVYSYRVFEPDKLGLFRTLATLMAALAGIILIENRLALRRPHGFLAWVRSWVGTPLVGVALTFALVYIVTTLWSVAPRVSLMGSYQRLQGTYSTLCYIIVFGCILGLLHSRDQIERVLTVIVVTSLPIALYGLLQHHGLDPLPWQGDVTTRLASSLGNAIFVGAYLVMVIPVTLGRLVVVSQHTSDGQPASPRVSSVAVPLALVALQVIAWAMLSFSQASLVAFLSLCLSLLFAALTHRSLAAAAQTSVAGLVLAIQLVALLFCGSRGPQVGLLGGFVLFALLAVALARRRGLAIGAVATGLTLLVLLAVLNLPDSPLARVRDLPYVGRLGRLLELESGTGKVRTLIWEGSVELLQDDPLRTTIGYGPESMSLVFNPFYPPALAQVESRTASPDRAHNETFDVLITTGVLGLAVHLALFVGVFTYGLTALGLTPDRRARKHLVLCAAVGGALGFGIPILAEGTLRLAGVGLPIGVIGGLLAYVAARALLGCASPTDLQGWQRILIMSLLAGALAHWIEISVGIAIGATRLYFWTYAALVVCALRWRVPTAEPESHSRPSSTALRQGRGRRSRRSSWPELREPAIQERAAAAILRQPEMRSLVALALVLSMVLITLAWDLMGNPDGVRSTVQILSQALAGLTTDGRSSLGPLWMGLLVYAVIGIAALASWRHSVQGPTLAARLYGGAIAFGIPAALCVVYAVTLAARLRPPVDTATLIVGYLVVAAVVALCCAIALYNSKAQAGRTEFRPVVILYALLIIGALFLAWRANLRPILADTIYKQGLRYDGAQEWAQAAAKYELALQNAPSEDYYLLFAGRARLEQARAETDRARQDELFQIAIDRLEAARALSPLNTDHAANLARAYRSWAEVESDAALTQERLRQALDHYTEALALSPHNAQLYNESGMTLAALGDTEQARAAYERSLALDSEYATTYLLLGDLNLDAQEWPEAINLYEQAMARAPDSVAGWSRLAYAYAQIERWDEAIAANLSVLELAPEDYITLRNLVYIYHTRHEDRSALVYLDRALAVAPASEAAGLKALRQQLEQE